MKLKFDGREIELTGDVTTLGRTPDNLVSFPNDANVSRCHAEIEKRGDEYCLIDLGSSNGTTVNDQKISGETYLKPGDVILLGGTSKIEVVSPNDESNTAEKIPAANIATPSVAPSGAGSAALAADAAPSGGSNMLLLIAGGVVCIALLFVIVVAALYYFSGSSGGSSGGGGGLFSRLFGSSCDAKATITKPESGDTISAPAEIELEVQNGECVSKAIFTIDGVEFAKAEAPFSASIDPKEFPDLSDGVDHSLGVTLVDEEGNPIGENAPVLLAFETRAVTKPSPETQVAQTNTQQQGPAQGQTKQVSLIDVQDMAKRMVGQFSGKHAYNVSNKQFLLEVQKRTADYAQEGYFERASRYR
ncbi:MAG: FHA domain-containing protein, partial [Methylococcales bacterium]